MNRCPAIEWPGWAVAAPLLIGADSGRIAGYGGGVNVEVTPLPGIGVRKDFALRDGRRIGVVSHRDGKLGADRLQGRRPRRDAGRAAVDDEEAGALANLLGAPQLVAQLAEEQRDLPGIYTGRCRSPRARPTTAARSATPRLRTPHEASRWSPSMRAGQVHPSPMPGLTLTAGDLLVVVGTSEGLDARRQDPRARLNGG